LGKAGTANEKRDNEKKGAEKHVSSPYQASSATTRSGVMTRSSVRPSAAAHHQQQQQQTATTMTAGGTKMTTRRMSAGQSSHAAPAGGRKNVATTQSSTIASLANEIDQLGGLVGRMTINNATANESENASIAANASTNASTKGKGKMNVTPTGSAKKSKRASSSSVLTATGPLVELQGESDFCQATPGGKHWRLPGTEGGEGDQTPVPMQ
jgi:hypothetical protein